MLSHLSIQNYAIIDKLEIEFSSGLTIITGETGAGKSILIGALSLILGQRADTKSLNDKSKKCVVEGIFDLKNYSLEIFFEKNNLDYSEQTAIRREINSSGISRAFINDTPVSLQQLKELTLNLVDIHSQHESLLLNTSEFQFNIVDSFAQQKNKLNEYKIRFRNFQQLQTELNLLLEKEQKSKFDKDYFLFQFEELEKANLKIGEQENSERELEIQNNSEEIKKNIFNSVVALNQGEASVISILSDVKKYLSEAAKYNSSLHEIEKRLQSTTIEIEDISSELEKIQDDISFSPGKIEEINNRLNIIYSLQQKHRVKTVEELISIKVNFSKKLSEISSLDNEIENLHKKISEEKTTLQKFAQKISDNRKKVIPKLEKNVNSILKELGMPNAKFEVHLAPNPSPRREGSFSELSIYGIDTLNFLFSANKGSEPREIQKVASGGELSRLMLALKSIIAKLTALPTIIFDEIDSGVSGEIADRVGEIKKKMSEQMQVISITHLPQIASKGDNHFFIYKENKNRATKTFLKKLNENERVNEVARMLSGEELSKAAIENAKELLKM